MYYSSASNYHRNYGDEDRLRDQDYTEEGENQTESIVDCRGKMQLLKRKVFLLIRLISLKMRQILILKLLLIKRRIKVYVITNLLMVKRFKVLLRSLKTKKRTLLQLERRKHIICNVKKKDEWNRKGNNLRPSPKKEHHPILHPCDCKFKYCSRKINEKRRKEIYGHYLTTIGEIG